MKQVILKYPIPLEKAKLEAYAEETIKVPTLAQILKVENDAKGNPSLYVLNDIVSDEDLVEDLDGEVRLFIVFTGYAFGPKTMTHLNTLTQGPLVYHIFLLP